MKVAKIHIASYRGANRRPSGGDVTFDDGKCYGWSLHGETGEPFFSGNKKVSGENQFFTFSSVKRASALTEHLNKG